MLRRILKYFLIAIAALALYIAGDILYRYFTPFYKPGLTILEGAYRLEQKTAKQLWENDGILKELEHDMGWVNKYPSDSLAYRRIYQKAQTLHKAASALTATLDKTITWGDHENKFLGEAGPDGKRKELDIYSDPVPVTFEYAKSIKQALTNFQALLPDTFHSTQSNLRYNRLRMLTGLSDAEFYNQFYQQKAAYLLVGELAVLKAALVGLEAEYLQNLLNHGKQFLKAEINRIFIPYTSDAPSTFKAGDTATFTVRLAAPFKFNKKNAAVFEFPAGKIDSIMYGSVAYVSFLSRIQTGSSGTSDLTEYKLPATIRFKVPQIQGRDTTFKTDLRILLKGMNQ